MITYEKSTNTPLLLTLVMTSLLFSASACSNPAAVNTNNDLPEYKEGQASVEESLANTEKPTFRADLAISFLRRILLLLTIYILAMSRREQAQIVINLGQKLSKRR